MPVERRVPSQPAPEQQPGVQLKAPLSPRRDIGAVSFGDTLAPVSSGKGLVDGKRGYPQIAYAREPHEPKEEKSGFKLHSVAVTSDAIPSSLAGHEIGELKQIDRSGKERTITDATIQESGHITGKLNK